MSTNPPQYITIDDDESVSEPTPPPTTPPPAVDPSEDPFTNHLVHIRQRLLEKTRQCCSMLIAAESDWATHRQAYLIKRDYPEDESSDRRKAYLAMIDQRKQVRKAMHELRNCTNNVELLLNVLDSHNDQLFWQNYE